MRVEAFSVMIFRLSTTPGTTSCSRPEYRSSVFSRTMTRSTFEKRLATPGRFETGRRFAYSSSALRSPTFTLVKPSPIGVVTGPLSATLFRRIDARSSSGSDAPDFFECGNACVVSIPVDGDAGGLQNGDDRIGDFRTDAVARNQRNAMGHPPIIIIDR